ncbi:MAG TPA: hypothetical protein VGM30_10280 [Puia sp.]|jgi:superfamily II DNA or RNA helicase
MDIRDQVQDKMAAHVLTVRDIILLVSIRVGKTRVALKAIEAGDSVLVVYPLLDVKKSWEEELMKFIPLSTNITFTTKNSLHKYRNRYFDFVIVDEPQLCQSANQIASLRTITYRKRVGLTGTLSDKTKKKFETLLNWKVGLTYTIADAIKDKLVKDYEIFVHYIDLDKRDAMPFEQFGRTFYGTEDSVYTHYTEQMVEAEAKKLLAMEDGDSQEIGKWTAIFKKYMSLRTNFLYNSPTLLNYTQRLIKKFETDKLLIYTLRTDIADQLSSVSYHSKNKEEEVLAQFKESTEGHMAVVNCVQAGVTIKGLHKVIFHSYESNTETLHQKLGRSLLYEFAGQKSQIHIACLKGTQMELWVDKACRSLEQHKINYIFQGKIYNKLTWIKSLHPDKELYIYNGSVVFFSHIEDGYSGFPFRHYKFLENPVKSYALPTTKMVRL